MSRMKVAIVSTKRDWHGGEEQTRQLAEGLRRRGHDCYVLAPRSSEIAVRMKDEGFAVSTFGGRGRSPWDLWRIRRRLVSVRPDILHFNDSHALTAAGVAALGLKIPGRVVARRVDFAIKSPWQYRFFTDRVICVSDEVARVCRQGGIAPRSLRVVLDGIDPQRTAGGDRERGRRALGIDDSQRLLLTVARMTDHKGHRFLLDAFRPVLARYPKSCLALAGDGELRDSLEQQARDLGIERNVQFLGYRSDIPDLIVACDLFVMPSHMEGLCSSLIDVMYNRRPIVATTAGGIPELVGRITGDEHPVAQLAPPCDPASLADAICQALADPQRTAKMTERAYTRACTRFTGDHMVEATLDVYRELVPARDAAPPAARDTARAA